MHEAGPKGMIAVNLELASPKPKTTGLREEGVVETVKGDFGFIKGCDRTKNIYFRPKDVIDLRGEKYLGEGMEVEFEIDKADGRQSKKENGRKRAINIVVVPKGTVRFEVTLTSGVKGTVIAQPRIIPHDKPGLLRLHEPMEIAALEMEHKISKLGFNPSLASSDGLWLERIELWPRCLPEGMIMREGDIATTDVQTYRPDALVFARKMKIETYRSLGRETGIIKVTKPESGFGFISFQKREGDIYFRLSDLSGGQVGLRPDMPVSFDVSTEQVGRGGSTRFRAVRLQIEQNSGSSGSSQPFMLEGLKGKMNRNWRHNSSALRMDGSFCVHLGSTEQRVALSPSEIQKALSGSQSGSGLIEAIEAFRAEKDLTEGFVEYLSPSQRLEYHRCLDEHFPGIAHSSRTMNSDIEGSALIGTLRMWKLDDEAYATWKQQRDSNEKKPNAASPDSVFNQDAGKDQKKGDDFRWMTNIPFMKGDADESRGPLTQDAEVEFSLCIDAVSGKRIARNVRLALEAVEHMRDGYEDPATGINAGVLEIVKFGKYGFIRRIPDDQKLFWHISDFGGVDPNEIQEGTRVLFLVARKGGLRCAINIKLIPFGAPTQYLPLGDLPWIETILNGRCRAVAISPDEVVVVNSSDCQVMQRASLDVGRAIQAIESLENAKNHDWKKTTLEDKDAANATSQNAPATTTGECAEGEAKKAVSSIEAEADNEIKYFPPIRALALMFPQLPDGPLRVGETVTCRVLSHWCAQRQPIRALDVQRSNSEECSQLKGVITRPKMTVDGMDLSQITVKPERDGKRNIFYCDYRDVTTALSNGRVTDVEFFGEEATGVAVAVTALSTQTQSSNNDRGIVFQRRPVNASLMQSQVGAGLSHKDRTIVAKRPADETDVGFVEGWRPLPNVAALPWGGLLRHLI